MSTLAPGKTPGKDTDPAFPGAGSSSPLSIVSQLVRSFSVHTGVLTRLICPVLTREATAAVNAEARQAYHV